MNKVICYPHCCVPNEYDTNVWYFEMFSTPDQELPNLGYVGARFFRELKRSKICPSELVLDFAIIALGVVAADKAVLRKNSADGWTRKIELTLYVHQPKKWEQEKENLEWMLRFLSGDFWSLTLLKIPKSLVPTQKYDLKSQDCICLLSGGMDSLVGAIDLHESGRNPLFVSQVVRGDAEHQREYAAAIGKNNLCQWSNYVNKKGSSENSTRTRSIVFFAFALLASCGICCDSNGRKEIYVPENGFISLNTPLDPLRKGSLSTKTTHPVYMDSLQKLWDNMGFGVDLVLPYKYMTKGEVLLGCKNQELMKEKIFGSTSCGKYQRHDLRHCGVCVPCIVRRAAFARAKLDDITERGYCIDEIKHTNSRDVAAAMFAIGQAEKYGIESVVQGTLGFVSGEVRAKYVGVVDRGIKEIAAFFKGCGLI